MRSGLLATGLWDLLVMPDRHKLFLIDGSSYLFRAFYAIRHLSNSKGLPTNATFGFTQMLLKVLKEHRPDYLAVIFDSKAPTFRSEVYKEYKANRPAMPEGLTLQIPYIKKIIEGYRIALLEMDGYEADDLIGTVAKRLESEVDVVIITGDKDILQLVSDRIQVYDTMKEKRLGVDEVIQRFGVSPEQVVEVMGLSGDAIDNIPGVPGIGEKTAIQLIKTLWIDRKSSDPCGRNSAEEIERKFKDPWRSGSSQPAVGNDSYGCTCPLSVKGFSSPLS